MQEKFKKLLNPFPASDIEWRVQSCGEKNSKIWARVLAYVDNRAIMNRLDDVIGAGNWKNYYEATPTGKGTLCGIAIRIGDEWVTKWDGADDTNIEATKGGLSGSMKRAAVHWGIGRYLYKLDVGYADICADGENYTYDKKLNKSFKWNPPALPKWALPDGEKETVTGGKSTPKGKFEQELEDDKKKDKPPTEKELQEAVINKVKELIGEYPEEGKKELLKFVYKIPNLRKLPITTIEDGIKKIKAMLEVPTNIERLRGKIEQPLIDPTADPIAPAGHIDPEKKAVEWKANRDKIQSFKKLMPEDYYHNIKPDFGVKKSFNEIKELAKQRKVIKALEEIVDKIKQATEDK